MSNDARWEALEEFERAVRQDEEDRRMNRFPAPELTAAREALARLLGLREGPRNG